MEYWIIYDLNSGVELTAGFGPAGSSAIQDLPAGVGMVVVPREFALQQPRNLDLLKAMIDRSIDVAADAICDRFITNLPSQIGRYSLKEAAARRWLADNGAPVWMLEPEATARGMTIAALAAEVIARQGQWEIVGGLIEGLRFGAKTRLAAATTIGAIVEAGKIDWAVLDGPAG